LITKRVPKPSLKRGIETEYNSLGGEGGGACRKGKRKNATAKVSKIYYSTLRLRGNLPSEFPVEGRNLGTQGKSPFPMPGGEKKKKFFVDRETCALQRSLPGGDRSSEKKREGPKKKRILLRNGRKKKREALPSGEGRRCRKKENPLLGKGAEGGFSKFSVHSSTTRRLCFPARCSPQGSILKKGKEVGPKNRIGGEKTEK